MKNTNLHSASAENVNASSGKFLMLNKIQSVYELIVKLIKSFGKSWREKRVLNDGCRCLATPTIRIHRSGLYSQKENILQ